MNGSVTRVEVNYDELHIPYQFDTEASALAEAFDVTEAADDAFAHDVLEGLSRNVKMIPSRWLYDARGSELFSQIMSLEEYYPTARETEILESHSGSIARMIADEGPYRVVELGAGDGQKTVLLLREMLRERWRFDFSPIDISAAALREMCSRLSARLPGLDCVPVEGDNLERLGQISERRRAGENLVVLFLGSSIGNCEREEVLPALHQIASRLEPGDFVLIGFDLIKCSKRLVRAYSDSRGVTAEFNYNLLDRMNRELGANFDRAAFKHEATWNPAKSAMESWLVSLRDQVVWLPACARSYRLRKWEPIHTEVSLKFDEDEVRELARQGGFQVVEHFVDEARDFLDALWRVEPIKSV